MNAKLLSKKLFMMFILLGISVLVYAQKAPMKYGKVDKADLEMKAYPADTSAAAVILCNYGYFSSQNLQFVHQVRIKILKEEGKSWGNYYAPAAEKTDVKGQTVNLENGAPVVSKLNKESIFIEKMNKGRYRARVAMPNVKVGSVIDLEIVYTGLPNYWRFQESIPVRWSELVLEPNQYIKFRKNQSGYVPLAISTADRWAAGNVPAFKPEPYVNNAQNYLSRFDIEISLINIPERGIYREYATTWESVADILRADNDFGVHFKTPSFFLNSLEKQIKSEATTPEQRLAKAYEAIRKIKWNKTESLWASSGSLGTILDKKVGNSADINLLLTLLLRKLDIDANPLVLSTRANGVLPVYSVSLDKLNYVIAHAVIGDKSYLLDATDETLTMDLLPKRVINGPGLLVRKDGQAMVDVTVPAKDKTITMFDLKLSPEGVLTGNWSRSGFQYSASDLRKKYRIFNSRDEYLKSVENSHFGLSVEDYQIDNLDSINNPVVEKYTIEMKNQVTKSNNQLIVNPVQFCKWKENPFKSETREYPIDFTTNLEETQILKLEVPAGYQVEKLPENVRMALPDNAATFLMQCTAMENAVQVIFRLNINKPVFLQTEYLDLKAFFDQLVKKQSEMIIIKKV